MALPDDPETRLRCYRNALRNWKVHGYITFKKVTQEWLLREMPELSLREICRVLHEYVEQGGTIDEQVERRPDFTHDEFHYDLRVKIGTRRLYFETVLMTDEPDDPDDPVIVVVSVHDV